MKRSAFERVVYIKQQVISSLLIYAKANHPKEGILLLRGRVEKERIYITEVLIPPLATHGTNFSSFPLHMLPLGLSIIGIAHSHPSGVPRPSVEDLNHFYGRIMTIMTPPYMSVRDLATFTRDGSLVKQVIEMDDHEDLAINL